MSIETTLTREDVQDEIDALVEMRKADEANGTLTEADKKAFGELVDENREVARTVMTKSGAEIVLRDTIGAAPIPVSERKPEPYVDPGYAQAKTDNWRTGDK